MFDWKKKCAGMFDAYSLFSVDYWVVLSDGV